MKANILNEHDANMMIWERSTVQYMSNILPHALHKGHLAVAHEIAGGYLFNDQSHGYLPRNKKNHGYLEFIFLLRQWVAEKNLEQASTYVNCLTKLIEWHIQLENNKHTRKKKRITSKSEKGGEKKLVVVPPNT